MPISPASCRSGSRNPLEQSAPTMNPVPRRERPSQLLRLKVLCCAKWFSRHGGAGLTVGLDDLRGLFQP